jgi:hypothetical protein
MKKGIAILLIAILVTDLTSCTSYRQLSTQEDYEIYQKNDHIQVLEIHSTKDSVIRFSEKYPGKMTNRQVYGLKQVHFPYNLSDSIIFTSKDKNAAFILDKNILYKIISQDKSGFICISPDTVRTPFSEVSLMKIKKIDPLKTTLLIMGISGVIVGISVYIVSISMFDIGLTF